MRDTSRSQPEPAGASEPHESPYGPPRRASTVPYRLFAEGNIKPKRRSIRSHSGGKAWCNLDDNFESQRFECSLFFPPLALSHVLIVLLCVESINADTCCARSCPKAFDRSATSVPAMWGTLLVVVGVIGWAYFMFCVLLRKEYPRDPSIAFIRENRLCSAAILAVLFTMIIIGSLMISTRERTWRPTAKVVVTTKFSPDAGIAILVGIGCGECPCWPLQLSHEMSECYY